MKSNKTAPTKAKSTPAAPVKMESALTNLNRAISMAPPSEKAESALKPARKTISVEKDVCETKPVARPVTAVEAKIDVGFGNTLFIRGNGLGLSWEKGVPLECRDQSTWIWRSPSGQEPVEFKLLLNDQIWATGQNVTVAPGSKVELVPSF